jgi:Fe-S cluster assembly protein SufD
MRNNLNIVLNGTHCTSHLNGLQLLSKQQHLDNHTLVDHQMPHCESNQLYKGILNDKSTGVFNGKIFVRKDAQKTNAYQSSKNMLLSDDATMNTKPQLEIYADDVKCSHGSSTGQIDENAVFYLRARGISPDSAKSLLMYAFAIDVIQTIKIESYRNYLDSLIEKHFQS